MSCTLSGTTLTATSDLNLNSTGSVNLNSSGNITSLSAYGLINLQNNTTTYGTFYTDTGSNSLVINAKADQQIILCSPQNFVLGIGGTGLTDPANTISMYRSATTDMYIDSSSYNLFLKSTGSVNLNSSGGPLSLKSSTKIYISPNGINDNIGFFTSGVVIHIDRSTTGFRLQTNDGGHNLILDSFDSGENIFLIPFNDVNRDYLNIGKIDSGGTPDGNTGGLLLSSISNMNIKANSGVINLISPSGVYISNKMFTYPGFGDSITYPSLYNNAKMNVQNTQTVYFNNTGAYMCYITEVEGAQTPRSNICLVAVYSNSTTCINTVTDYNYPSFIGGSGMQIVFRASNQNNYNLFVSTLGPF